jgi:hypothetical protein
MVISTGRGEIMAMLILMYLNHIATFVSFDDALIYEFGGLRNIRMRRKPGA